MKNRLLATALLIVVLTISLNNTASAHGWGHHHGWFRPPVVVRVYPPVPQVAYYPPAYSYYPRPYVRHEYCRPRYYERHERHEHYGRW